MRGSIHAKMQRQAEKLFTNGLPPRRHTRLRDHLRDCDACRRHYGRLRQIEDAMFAEPDALNLAAVERMQDLAILAIPQKRELGLSAWAPKLVLAASTAVLLAVVATVWPPTENTENPFRDKGGSETALGAGLTLFRIDPTTRAVERLPRLPDGTRLRSGDIVQVAYSNREFSHAVVVGLDAQLEIQWYHPSKVGEDAVGVVLNPNAVDELFEQAWTITAPEGPLRLYAIFANDPMSPAAVRVAVDTLRREGRTPRQAVELPGIGMHQDSFLFEVRR